MIDTKFSFTFKGSNIGNIAGSYLTGIINRDLGWEYNFYVNGIFALLVALIWCFVASNTPQENPLVSENELNYISQNIVQNDVGSEPNKIPPFWDMIKSRKVWALVRIKQKLSKMTTLHN